MKISLAILVGLCTSILAQEYDIDEEIRRKNAELTSVLKQQNKTRQEIMQDKRDFNEYQSRTRERMDNINAQTDSIKASIVAFKTISDSVGAVIGSFQREKQEIQLRQQQVSNELIKQCEMLMQTSALLPPLVSQKSFAALDFLKSELSSGSVDIIEGINRLMRVARETNVELMDIQVIQGSSPIPRITGTTYRLRMGGVFEAVVKGETGAIWDFENEKWVMLDDPQKARMIMDAVEVRTGKKQPSLVSIPFSGMKKSEGSN